MSEPKTPTSEPDDAELLDSGQEEVFSRTEVEQGRIEHATEAGHRRPPPASGGQNEAGASSGSGASPS